ncbi:hypothetical protein [Clavibacter michiganensis]|uniref:Integral membrane protein n=1 Tax=Clavibacter michiganensis subsp. insidiosus TaxID=33014 RepID=A0A0D5CM21_9MICO|nr:hypothetical protein [Clavibacter michiganensis]AJW80686.1 hypothetical protein VO01_15700 [Clavibacter michiganensis subsp. insidiosus]AWF99879.1 hypothetical protein BEH61_15340 [Clavibacter michiganensis subsp. insidiosus]
MGSIHTAAFVILSLVFVLRTRSAVRTPRARLSWLASGFGALAVLTLGSIIPVEVMDGALGGDNVLYLVQNYLASTAFWLLVLSTVPEHDVAPMGPLRRYGPMMVVFAGFTIAFVNIHRGPTSITFIHDHIEQLSAVLCASIYLVGIVVISVRLVIAAQPSRSASYWPFRIGGALCTVGALNEIVWLFIGHYIIQPAVVQAAGYAAFDPLFYSGVILIVAGIASFTVRKWVRDTRMTIAIRRLTQTMSSANVPVPQVSRQDVYGDNRLMTAYDLLIRLRDEELAGRIDLTPHNRRVVAGAEAVLTRELASSQTTSEARPRPTRTDAR